jgi:putative transposase
MRRWHTLCFVLFSTRKTIQNKGDSTMSKDNVISLESPAENKDLLTGLLRSGTRDLITKAVQSELAEFLSQYQDMTDSEGRPLLVRNGYLPERKLMTGIGPVDIKVP